MLDRNVWALCCVLLGGAYPHTFKLDLSALEVWYEMLKDLPSQKVLDAVQTLCKSEDAFPSIGAIRKLVSASQGYNSRKALTELKAKLPKIVRPVTRFDAQGNPFYEQEEWDDPLIPMVIEDWGGTGKVYNAWTFGGADQFDRQFEKAYHCAYNRASSLTNDTLNLKALLPPDLHKQILQIQVKIGSPGLPVLQSPQQMMSVSNYLGATHERD